MNTQRWNRIMASAIMGLCLCSTAEALTVDTTNDSNTPADGECSLREAINAVNTPLATPPECISAPPAPAVINFTLPDPSTITLLSALPALVNSVAITGPGAASLAVSGNNSFPIFNITGAGVTVAISDLTIRNGGGAAGNGVLIGTGSTLVMERTRVNTNTGSGLQFDLGSIGGSITDSTVSNNTGGGILSNAILLLVERSTVSGNGAAGAGIQAGAGTLIINSTISSNLGTGILVGIAAGLTMFSSTVTGNGGAGLSNDGIATTVNSTIFSTNTGDNCTFTQAIISSGYNLEDTDVCGFANAGDLPDTHPGLGPLKDNGGPTLTHALSGGIGSSPAIDKGDPATCGTTLVVDQRGVVRPNSGGKCDSGAYEWHANGGGGSGSGCSSPAGEGTAFDPTLWLLALVSCIYLGYRRPYTT